MIAYLILICVVIIIGAITITPLVLDVVAERNRLRAELRFIQECKLPTPRPDSDQIIGVWNMGSIDKVLGLKEGGSFLEIRQGYISDDELDNLARALKWAASEVVRDREILREGPL